MKPTRRVTEEEYNILKTMGFAAVKSISVAVGKEYAILPPKNYKCNGVAPLDGDFISVRCSQSMPHVVTKINE